MKYIVIGLGNFGSSLAMRLTELGHEVIAVDKSMQKVDAYKNKITHTINMDCTDEHAISTLPLKDTDVVIVGIGEDIGSSLMATATLKQLKVKRLISRSISALHRTVVEAIGVDEIISPEEDSAERLAKRLEMRGVIDSFYITEDYNIIEAKAPTRYIGQTIAETDFRARYKINVLTIIRMNTTASKDHRKGEVLGVVTPDMKIEENDILVLFGRLSDLEKLLHF
ncbi:TrkA family potassium uptake protein [Cytophagaceae bacterium ABcell3]|nr:TrkA family potassium uptake protein [Cytophagaceae bacterium ABcell3]